MKNPHLPADDHLNPHESPAPKSVHKVGSLSGSSSKNSAKRSLRRSLFAAALMFGIAATMPLRAADNPGSAAQFLERGRAEAKAGQTGQAILDFERAAWLAPRDAAIAKQLAAARAQAGLAEPQRTPLSRAAHAMSFDALTALASISFLMFALLVFGTRLLPVAARGISRAAAAGFGVLMLLGSTGVAARWPELHRAVVTAADPVVHAAPADSAAAPFVLKAGDVVRVDKSYGSFLRVLAPGGQTGWIHETSIEHVIPGLSKTSSAHS